MDQKFSIFMLKNKKFLEEHASYCVDRLINKLGATDCEVVVANSVGYIKETSSK